MTEQQHIQVCIGEHGEHAELAIAADADPSVVTPTNLVAAVTAAGIPVTEPIKARLTSIAATFCSRPRRLVKVIAKAVAPVNGRDGQLRWRPGFDPTVKVLAAGRQGGLKANHYAGLHYVHVKPGDHVADLIEATIGTAGRTVLGKPLKPSPGAPCPVKFSPAFRIDEQRVLARCEGVIHFERDKLSIVDRILVPGSVDFKTGNIDAQCAVEINNDVRSMFTVKAEGNLAVGGLIEAATIICGGHFTCRRGMAAKDRGELTVGGNVEIGYLNNVRGSIKGNLTVHREIIDCDLIVKGDVTSSTATIIGGTLAAESAVSLATAGSPSGKPTVVHLSHGPLRIATMLHAGVIVVVDGRELALYESLRGPVRLSIEEGQPVLRSSDGSALALESVARIRKAAA